MQGSASSRAGEPDQARGLDPLSRGKCSELPVLDEYARWQSEHMRHVTARQLDDTKPLEQQAHEAALSARWKLVDQAPQRLRTKPHWVVVGAAAFFSGKSTQTRPATETG